MSEAAVASTEVSAETLGTASVSRRVYAYTVPGRRDATWTRDVGGQTNSGIGLIKVGDTTKPAARERIKEQLGTAYPKLEGVDILLDEHAQRENGTFFRDYDVHRALRDAGIRRVGGEWFEATLDEVKAAIASLRSGKKFHSTRTADFGMRPEQEDAVLQTAAYFRAHQEDSRPARFLWNAKMRFGKTFTTYQLAREMEWSRVLVLTFKPAVQTAWKEDLENHVDFEGWHFVDATTPPIEAAQLADGPEPLVWFASLQDINGKVEGEVKERNEALYLVDWDVIVVDEYHFGAWRDSARELYDAAEKKLAAAEEPDQELDVTELAVQSHDYLMLSGTPFRALTNGEFNEDAKFDWTYIDEQKAKDEWPGPAENPYVDLPGIEMFMYRISQSAEAVADEGEFDGFNLNEFFRASRVDGNYQFAEPTQVREFLEMLRGKLSAQMRLGLEAGKKPPFPYEDAAFAKGVRHSVWYMNDVASCQAMKAMLDSHPYFSGYDVHVAAGTRAGMGSKAKGPVDELIHNAEATGRSGTITLSCGKLMTGVTIKQWSAIFMLRSLKSPESYFQAAFRVQSPWSNKAPGEPRHVLKDPCYVFEFDPNRALSLVATYATQLATNADESPQAVLGELLNYLPIFAFDGSAMEPLNAEDLMNWATAGIGSTALAQRWNSPLLVDVTEAALDRLLGQPELLRTLDQMEAFRGLSQDVQKVVTSTKQLKGVKRDRPKLTSTEKKEQDATRKLRKEIREKLQKFLAKIPVFMYLTDHREESLVDVIRSLDPDLFERVTGLVIADFELLSDIGVFNAERMSAAIWQFRQFESASLSYAEEEPVARDRRVGLWDESVVVAIGLT
ncbi:GIY-YIG nuclease family protein [Microbacterium sp.]|uniref:GIY-YIG nuclease family protein n=1 Tax=Microbacterium sp. TaxID=51671 RepID=UPI002733A500|nr:GIY-YIG nuclease family protein [Microbacterium sp.]MDP3951157.1 GIY-YIG nuclease family protein [Microbacterium sp.]